MLKLLIKWDEYMTFIEYYEIISEYLSKHFYLIETNISYKTV